MSLYDDLVIDGDIGDKQTNDGWSKTSGIRLLHEHLQNKKAQQNQNKRESRKNPSLHHMAITSQVKPKSDDLCPPPPPAITAINISYVGKESKGSLLGGDWDVAEEYDPIWPNDYEKITRERRDKKDREKELERTRELEDRDRRRRERFERTATTANNRSLGLDYGDDDEEAAEDKTTTDGARGSGAMIAPPPSLLESFADSGGGGSVAAKIMARMGYKEGQGLGREEQGMSTALLVEKTSKRGGKIIHEKDSPREMASEMPPPPPPLTVVVESAVESITEIMKNPSKVVLLRNMVGPGEVDDMLETETKEECGKYGEVSKCVIFELTGAVSDEEAVRIFIEFRRVESAIKGLSTHSISISDSHLNKAVVDLNGRYFGGRIVRANFYDVDRFKKLELKD